MPVETTPLGVRVTPGGPAHVATRPPGSKSLTNRALLCAALAAGRSTIMGASTSTDAERMCAGLAALGVSCDRSNETIRVHGLGARLGADDAIIDAHDAGTVIRFLTAASCLAHSEVRLTGTARMRERPIGPLVDAMRELGAVIRYDGVEGYPPLTVFAKGLRGGQTHFAQLNSSQYVSATLMVAPCAMGDVFIRVEGAPSAPYIDMTTRVMRAFGVELVEENGAFVVPGPQAYCASEFEVEPDASAATYHWAAAAVTGGVARVSGLSRNSAQGDVGFVDLLAEMGCEVIADGDDIVVHGPKSGRLRGIDADLNAMPDTAQTLAIVALFADGETRIRNTPNLRIKETDRIAAMATELTKLGAEVTTYDDGLSIQPPKKLNEATVDSWDDHRMAMSLALVGLAGPAITIRRPECVSKSYPGYFEAIASWTRAFA
ncbi:MAG: 3-phosphoshikimate 1-carboxyvinyltransferase [Phycisphaerales bacterium]|nr:3-phosphoshikimate 1-carboxyvinyltransferase [Phycisphaerales bacterium]